jgi:hypothetical protein
MMACSVHNSTQDHEHGDGLRRQHVDFRAGSRLVMKRAGTKFRYRSAIARRGEAIGIRRYTGFGSARPVVNADLRGRVIGYQPQELIGGITQGARKVIVPVEELIAKQLALPITTNDNAVVRGKEFAIIAVDDDSHRDGAELIANCRYVAAIFRCAVTLTVTYGRLIPIGASS